MLLNYKVASLPYICIDSPTPSPVLDTCFFDRNSGDVGFWRGAMNPGTNVLSHCLVTVSEIRTDSYATENALSIVSSEVVQSEIRGTISRTV